MKTLEARIPPPMVVFIFGVLMWLGSAVTPFLTLRSALPVAAAAAVAGIGFLIELASIFSFVRAKTSADPTNPRGATALITSGIYRISRNPIYLGDLLILVGWAIYLSNGLSLAFVPAFLLYINRFQIQMEERAMQELFGDQYTAYKSRVRRWL